MQTSKGPVQKNSSFIYSVIKQYLKRATGCNQKLMAFFMSMRPTRLPARYVIRIEYPPYAEWNVQPTLHRSYISSSVLYSG